MIHIFGMLIGNFHGKMNIIFSKHRYPLINHLKTDGLSGYGSLQMTIATHRILWPMDKQALSIKRANMHPKHQHSQHGISNN